MNYYNHWDLKYSLPILLQILVYVQIILFFFLPFSSISYQCLFALCVAFGAKIKSVIEPDGVENLSFIFKKLHRPEPYILSPVSVIFNPSVNPVMQYPPSSNWCHITNITTCISGLSEILDLIRFLHHLFTILLVSPDLHLHLCLTLVWAAHKLFVSVWVMSVFSLFWDHIYWNFWIPNSLLAFSIGLLYRRNIHFRGQWIVFKDLARPSNYLPTFFFQIRVFESKSRHWNK